MKVTFALSDTGYGHRSVASAISDGLAGREGVETDTVDLFADLRVPLMAYFPSWYRWVSTNATSSYDALWHLTNNRASNRALSSLASRLASESVTGWLERSRPDVVVVTHPLYITGIVGQARADLGREFKVLVVVSDLVHPHASWVSGDADHIVVPTPEAREVVMRLDVSRQVTQTPFPIRAAFRRATCSPPEGRALLGLRESFTVLVAGGGAGSGHLASTVGIALDELPSSEVVVACGANRRLRAAITRRFGEKGRVRVLGPVDNFDRWVDASDVLLSKAGPSTIFEAAARGRPLLITAEVGAQERGNATWAEAHGLGTACLDERSVRGELRRLSRDGARIYSGRTFEDGTSDLICALAR